MKLPKKPTVTGADVNRLLPHMACWAKLNEMFLLDAIGLDDLARMIIIERRTHRRKSIHNRLVARYCSTLRNQLNAELDA